MWPKLDIPRAIQDIDSKQYTDHSLSTTILEIIQHSISKRKSLSSKPKQTLS